MDLTSATQIGMHEECARKFAWRYIVGIQTPQNEGAKLGQEVDDTQLQPYLRGERDGFDYTRESGYIAAAGLEYLPKPKSNDLELQHKFVIPSPTFGENGEHSGLGFLGYVDLWLPHGGAPGIGGDGIPCIGDFKTTKDFKWAKSKEALATDPQAQLYAMWALYETRAPSVDLAWIYFRTKKPYRAKRVHLRVTADHVAAQFERLNEIGLHLQALKEAGTDPLSLPPNVDMCDAFNGCPYRHKCNLSLEEKIDARAAQEKRRREGLIANMSNTAQPSGAAGTLAALRAKKAQQGGAPAPAPAPSPMTVATAPNGANVYSNVPKPAPALPPTSTAGGLPPISPQHAVVGKRADGNPIYAWELEGKSPAEIAALFAPAPITPPDVAPSPTLPPVVVGINPPESALPPAPPVGTAPAAAPARRGRPPKNPPPDPLGADVHMHTTKPDALPPVTGTPAETVRVVWGRECIQPIPYNEFEVGPFEATAVVRPGETITQAAQRVYAELDAFATKTRDAKAAAFATTLGGGSS